METITSAIRQQFNEAPYPNAPFSYSTKDKFASQFCCSVVTSYYYRYGQVVSPEGMWILDAGCGSGETTQGLIEANPGANFIGVDLSEKSIDVACSRIRHHGYENVTTFYAMPLEDISKLGITFDYINCEETLYLLPDPLAGLQAMKAVLKPTGMIRANLHSLYQREIYYRAQELFRLLKVDRLPQSEQLAQARLVLNALYKSTTLRSTTWRNPDFEDVVLLANHLLVGDKGFTILDLFTLLEAAELEFVGMTNWLKWNVANLFIPGKMPEYLEMLLAVATEQEKLHLFELLHPANRLMDFWCGHPQPPKENFSEEAWTDQEWLQAKIHLLPAVRIKQFQSDLDKAMQSFSPLVIDLPHVPEKVGLTTNLLLCIQLLWDRPKTVQELVDAFLKIKPISWHTLEPYSFAQVLDEVRASLLHLHQYLLVLIEK